MTDWTRRLEVVYPRTLKDQQAVTSAIAQAFVDVVRLETFENEYKMWDKAAKLSNDWGATETHGQISTAATPALATAITAAVAGQAGVKWYAYDAATGAQIDTNDARAADGIDWRPDVDLLAGDVRRYQWRMFEVIQSHRTQADWTPDVAVSLFKPYLPPGEALPYRQPQGAHDRYRLGARVIVDDVVWVSLNDANVWRPGSVGAENLWRREGEPEPDPDLTPEWVSGEQLTYSAANPIYRMYQGVKYQLRQSPGANIWIPPSVPALWLVVPT